MLSTNENKTEVTLPSNGLPPGAEELSLGSLSRLYHLKPDAVVWEMLGKIDAPALNDYFGFIETLKVKCGGQYFMVLELDNCEITPDGRKQWVTPPPGFEWPYKGLVYVGGSFTLRTMVSMITRAGRMLNLVKG